MFILFEKLKSYASTPLLAGLILFCLFVCGQFSLSVFADSMPDAPDAKNAPDVNDASDAKDAPDAKDASDAKDAPDAKDASDAKDVPFEELRRNADQEITVKKLDTIDIGFRKFASKDDPKGAPIYFGREGLLNFLYRSSKIKNLLFVKLDMNKASEAEVDSTLRALESFFRDLQYQRVVIYSESEGNIRTVSDTKYEQPEEDVSLPKYHSRSMIFFYYPPPRGSSNPEYRVDMGLGGPMNLKSASTFLQQVKHKDECIVVRLAKNSSQKFVEPYLRNLGFTNLQFERDPRVSPPIADERTSVRGKRARRRGK